jgi:hypothetical protein
LNLARLVTSQSTHRVSFNGRRDRTRHNDAGREACLRCLPSSQGEVRWCQPMPQLRSGSALVYLQCDPPEEGTQEYPRKRSSAN